MAANDVGNIFANFRSMAVSLEKNSKALKDALCTENEADLHQHYLTKQFDPHQLSRDLSSDVNNSNSQLINIEREVESFVASGGPECSKALKNMLELNAAALEELQEMLLEYGYIPRPIEKKVTPDNMTLERKADDISIPVTSSVYLSPDFPVSSSRPILLDTPSTPAPLITSSTVLIENGSLCFDTKKVAASPEGSNPPTPVIELKTIKLKKHPRISNSSDDAVNMDLSRLQKDGKFLSPMKTPLHRSIIDAALWSDKKDDILPSSADITSISLEIKNYADFPSQKKGRLTFDSMSPHNAQGSFYEKENDPGLFSTPKSYASMKTKNKSNVTNMVNMEEDSDEATPTMMSPTKTKLMSIEELEAVKIKDASIVLKQVTAEQFKTAPNFLSMQLSLKELNQAIDKVNSYAVKNPHPSDWVLSRRDVLELIEGDKKKGKTIMLSLIQFNRMKLRGDHRSYEIVHHRDSIS